MICKSAYGGNLCLLFCFCLHFCQLRPKQPVPKYAYKRGENDLMYLSSAYTHDQTREVRISRTVLVGEKYIIIPCAQEGFFNTMFLLRMVAPRKDILRFRQVSLCNKESWCTTLTELSYYHD